MKIKTPGKNHAERQATMMALAHEISPLGALTRLQEKLDKLNGMDPDTDGTPDTDADMRAAYGRLGAQYARVAEDAVDALRGLCEALAQPRIRGVGVPRWLRDEAEVNE